MRKAVVVIVAIAALAIAGCESKEQKNEKLSAEYQAANAQYQKECSANPSDQDANAIIGAALGSRPSPQQQAAINQHQREAEARKNSPHCKELDAKRDDLTKKILATQNQ
jgi:outer membrane murein-binding lipoprotein Lpp